MRTWKRTAGTAASALLVLTACASYPRQMTREDCARHVAHEMGYDVMPDGAWRERPGTVPPAGGQIRGAGVRISECVRAGRYVDAYGNVVPRP